MGPELSSGDCETETLFVYVFCLFVLPPALTPVLLNTNNYIFK